MNRFSREGYPVLSTDIEDHMKMLIEGQYVFMTDESHMKLEIRKSCHLEMGRELLLGDAFAIAFQNNSAYLDLFNEQ